MEIILFSILATFAKFRPSGGRKMAAIGGFPQLFGILTTKSTSYMVCALIRWVIRNDSIFGHVGQISLLWWPKMGTVGTFSPLSGMLITHNDMGQMAFLQCRWRPHVRRGLLPVIIPPDEGFFLHCMYLPFLILTIWGSVRIEQTVVGWHNIWWEPLLTNPRYFTSPAHAWYSCWPGFAPWGGSGERTPFITMAVWEATTTPHV